MRSIFIVNPKLIQSDKIVIYGAGRMGKKLKNRLLKAGINVFGFVDSDKLKRGTICDGKQVYDMDWLKTSSSACVIPTGYQEEIYKMCKNSGISDIFLDNNSESYGFTVPEDCDNVLYCGNSELLTKKAYVLGTGKYSRRLFILFSSLNINVEMGGFLQFSLDKPSDIKYVFNQKVMLPKDELDKDSCILVPRSIYELCEYSDYAENCWYESS